MQRNGHWHVQLEQIYITTANAQLSPNDCKMVSEGASSDNYGIFTEIGTNTGRGNIYGIYARAEGNSSSRVFAGYFAGPVGIGKTPAEEYTLPDSRGEENQILVSDNSGKVDWKHNHTRNYISTGSQSGTYIIGDEVYFMFEKSHCQNYKI